MTTQTGTNFTETTQDDWEFESVKDILAPQNESNNPMGADDALDDDPVYRTIQALVRAGETEATIINTVTRKHKVSGSGLGFLIQAARTVASRSEPESSGEAPQASQSAKTHSSSPNPTKSPYAGKRRRERAQEKEQRISETTTDPLAVFYAPAEKAGPTENDDDDYDYDDDDDYTKRVFISTLLPTKKQRAKGLFLMPTVMRAVLLASAQGRDKVELAGATYTFNIPIPTRRRFRQAFLAVWKALSKTIWMADLDFYGKPEGFSINVSGHLLARLAKGSEAPPSTLQAREMAEFVKMLDSLTLYENIPGRGRRAIRCFGIENESDRQRKIKIGFHDNLIQIIRNRNNLIPMEQKDFRLGKIGTILRNIKRGVVMKYQENKELVTTFLGKQDRFIDSLYPSAKTLKRSLKQQMNRLRSAVRQLSKIALDVDKYLSVSLTKDGKIVSRIITV